jgi:enoyl-CoA hydratase/carnithine racemase
MSHFSYADDHIQVSFDGAIAFLTLNRPAKRNALTQAMWLAFPEALERVRENADARVFILRSSTSAAFSAGADIGEFAAHAKNEDWRRANHAAIGKTQLMLAAFEKPTIAQVTGVCVGGGCGLANACDFRIASPDAQFGITPAKLGLVYSLHDTKLLVDLIGPSAAKLVLFTGRLFTAEQALAMGWINEIHSIEAIAAKTVELGHEISENSGYTARHAKVIVRNILDGASADTVEHAKLFFDAFDGPDHLEGVAAFLQKRKPRF